MAEEKPTDIVSKLKDEAIKLRAEHVTYVNSAKLVAGKVSQIERQLFNLELPSLVDTYHRVLVNPDQVPGTIHVPRYRYIHIQSGKQDNGVFMVVCKGFEIDPNDSMAFYNAYVVQRKDIGPIYKSIEKELYDEERRKLLNKLQAMKY